MKADPSELVRAHYKTLVDQRTGKVRVLDYIVFWGAPLAVGGACLLVEVRLVAGVSVGLLTVMGLLSAFFFGAMLQVAERAMDWADQGAAPSADTSRQAIFLGEIGANAGYASLICILTAAVFVAASAVKHTALLILSALGLGLAVHVVLMLLMVMVRIYALSNQRLTDVRTGQATVTPLPERRRA